MRTIRRIGSGALLGLLVVALSTHLASAGGSGGQHHVAGGRWVNVRTALSLCPDQTKSRHPIHVYGYVVISGGKYDTFGEVFGTREPDTIVGLHNPYAPGGLAAIFGPSFGGVRPDVWGWIGGTLFCGFGAEPFLDASEQRVR